MWFVRVLSVFCAFVLLTACSQENPVDGGGPDSSQNDADADADPDAEGDSTPEADVEFDADEPEDALPAILATLDNDGSQLRYHENGRIDLVNGESLSLLTMAEAVVWLDSLDSTGTELTTGNASDLTFETNSETDALGQAQRLLITIPGSSDEPEVVWTISAYPDGGFYTFQVGLENTTEEAISVAKISVLRVQSRDGGALFLGEHPSQHRILDNGSLTVFDFLVEVHPGDVEQSNIIAPLVPGDFQGRSVANWNHAVVDLEGEATWISGGLSFERSLPVINLSYDPRRSIESADGRQGFTFFSAEGAYLPNPKPVGVGERFDSELFYVHPTEPDALAGLEEYAERVATHLDIVPWTRRDGGRYVPNGWNSWSGSSSTGGYGRGINEEIILANLDVATREFRDWGMDWFQVDDGYQIETGDWEFRTDLFPRGPRWLSDEIRGRGFIPGLWISPFTVDPDAQLVVDHPEWIADWTPIGKAIGGNDLILDLTHPEVQNHLRELFERFHDDWGFDWLKMDFAYRALLGTGLHDPSMTREEAWDLSQSIVREAIGDETFFLAVSTIGLNYRHADGDRLTLDNMPVWDWQPGVDSDNHLMQQGLKPTIRNAGRRWYLQDRIWVNHPDLIFFRSNTAEESWPRLTLGESRAFCTFVGLYGGIVKLGDRLVDLDAEAINIIRTLLPSYGRAARPLELFTRDIPEVWHLRVDPPRDGYDESYELIGLFNWGYNVDMTTNPYTEIEDDGESLDHRIDLDRLGLNGQWLAYEFWNQEFLGEISGTLEESVASHDGVVIALRRPLGRPQFLGWNRQITMGATLLEEVSWDEDSSTLTLRAQMAAPSTTTPFTYHIAIYVPDGYAMSQIRNEGVDLNDLAGVMNGDVLEINFVPDASGDSTILIEF